MNVPLDDGHFDAALPRTKQSATRPTRTAASGEFHRLLRPGGGGRSDRVVPHGALRWRGPGPSRHPRPDRTDERRAEPADDFQAGRHDAGSRFRDPLGEGPGPRERPGVAVVPVAAGAGLLPGLACPGSPPAAPLTATVTGLLERAPHRPVRYRRSGPPPECGSPTRWSRPARPVSSLPASSSTRASRAGDASSPS